LINRETAEGRPETGKYVAVIILSGAR